MKKYIVTLLLSLCVVFVFAARRRAAKEAVAPQTRTQTSLAALIPSPVILPQITIGPGPTPCPPNCGGLRRK